MKLRELPEADLPHIDSQYGRSDEQVRAIQLQAAKDALEEAAKVCDVTPPEPFRASLEAAWCIRQIKVEQP